MTVALVTIVSGSTYIAYARGLFASADQYFSPDGQMKTVMLLAEKGWPAATMYRPKILARWLRTRRASKFDHVYLVDADARFEATVGSEVFPDGAGIVATLHPGYIGKPRQTFPYEDRPDSACCVPPERGEHYFCGGFIGGDRKSLLAHMESAAALIDTDMGNGLVPRWHDESAHNRLLAWNPPDRVLSPAYAHPDNDAWYTTWWPGQFARKLVMLDKPSDERAGR
jgi:glycosyl transferase family 6